jgi:hypothetical protein
MPWQIVDRCQCQLTGDPRHGAVFHHEPAVVIRKPDAEQGLGCLSDALCSPSH